jgi:hypothetical protein
MPPELRPSVPKDWRMITARRLRLLLWLENHPPVVGLLLNHLLLRQSQAMRKAFRLPAPKEPWEE